MKKPTRFGGCVRTTSVYVFKDQTFFYFIFSLFREVDYRYCGYEFIVASIATYFYQIQTNFVMSADSFLFLWVGRAFCMKSWYSSIVKKRGRHSYQNVRAYVRYMSRFRFEFRAVNANWLLLAFEAMNYPKVIVRCEDVDCLHPQSEYELMIAWEAVFTLLRNVLNH